MATLCELTADAAREIMKGASLRKLNEVKKTICQNIYRAAFQGKDYCFIDFCYYEVPCPEDWCNIYNWLKNLGYTVEDNSGRKINPNFIVKW